MRPSSRLKATLLFEFPGAIVTIVAWVWLQSIGFASVGWLRPGGLFKDRSQILTPDPEESMAILALQT